LSWQSGHNTTSFAYDGLGRLTIETNALEQSRSFYYDAAGDLARQVNRNGKVIQYVHDQLGRVTEEQ
jgi:YD repeat-containing protein